MANFYEIFEEPVLSQSLPCDDLLLLTPEPRSWNSCDSSMVSPVVSPHPRDLVIGFDTNSIPSMNVKPTIPLESLLQDHSVKVQRLNRKAKLARENRKRKKSRLQELEIECQDLRDQIKNLRQRERDIALKSPAFCALVKGEDLSHEAVLRQGLHDIALRISSGAEDGSELKAAITALEEFLNQRGHASLAQMRAYLDLELKSPQKGPEQFLFWALSRDKSFFEDPNGMWSSLFAKHLNIGEDELNELESLGASAQELRQYCSRVYEQFNVLSKSFEAFLDQAHATVGKCMDILSSDQVAMLIKWVADNQICVNELVR